MDNDQCSGRYHNGDPCRRPAVEGNGWCIFHLPEKKEEHYEEFTGLLEEEKGSQLRLHPEFLDFTGFSFPSPVVIEADLPTVYFKDAVFHDYVLFWDVKGQKSVRIKGDAWFNNCTFMDVADFSGALFRDAWFSGASFKDLVDFSNAVFRRAYFTGVEFKDDSRFIEARFLGYADFGETRFWGDGDFSGAHSEGMVSFNRCRFQNAWFTNARFRKVDFRDAVFLGEIDFPESDIMFQE
jgi:uncharacterized protein YjbI with pentapeptide repeats